MMMDGGNYAIDHRRQCHIYRERSSSKCDVSCLNTRDIHPELVWYNTPGHQGISGNKRADEEAKRVALGESSPQHQLPWYRERSSQSAACRLSIVQFVNLMNQYHASI